MFSRDHFFMFGRALSRLTNWDELKLQLPENQRDTHTAHY